MNWWDRVMDSYEPQTEDEKHFRDNWPLILWAARKYYRIHPMSVKIQAGIEIYLHCRQHHDPTKGKWGTYFISCFTTKLRSPDRLEGRPHEEGSRSRIIRIPDNINMNRIEKTVYERQKELGATHGLSDKELIELLGLRDMMAYKAARGDKSRVQYKSYYDRDEPHPRSSVGGGVEDPRTKPPCEQSDRMEFWETVREVLTAKNKWSPHQPNYDQTMKRRLDVIRMRFVEEKTLADCAVVLGVTPERVRQIEETTLDLLKAHPRIKAFYDLELTWSAGLNPDPYAELRELAQSLQDELLEDEDTDSTSELLEPSSVSASADESQLETDPEDHVQSQSSSVQ